MDTTPNPRMLEAMQSFTDALCGEAPTALETTSAAEERRDQRRRCMDFLHNLVRLSMREGVGRHYKEMGWPTVQDQVIPNALKQDPVHTEKIIVPQ